MKDIPTIQKPHWHFRASLPLVRNEHIKRPIFLSKFSLGYLGCSSATNHTWTLFVFGWALCSVLKHEWHDRTDKERADEYLAKWSECEKECRGFRLLQMGDENPDPALRKLLRDGLGVDLDEGTLR